MKKGSKEGKILFLNIVIEYITVLITNSELNNKRNAIITNKNIIIFFKISPKQLYVIMI